MKMMKHQQVRLLLAIVAMCLCVLGKVEAREAPVEDSFPAVPTDPYVDGDFYLYNVGEAKYLNPGEGVEPYVYLTDTPYRIRIEESPSYSGYYRLWFPTCSYYMDGGKTNFYLHAWSQGWQEFSFEKAEGGYYIHYRNSSSMYVGSTSSGTQITNVSEGNILWQFRDAKYDAVLSLYNALENADLYGYPVSRYDSIYSHQDEYSSSQLYEVAQELNRAVEFSNTLTKSSANEYPMLFTRTGPWWKVRKGYSNRVALQYNVGSYWNDWSYVTSYNDDPYMSNYGDYNLTRWDLPVTVAVDEDAVFSFIYYCYNNSYTPRLTILLDGQSLRQIGYEEGNMSRKYSVPLSTGVHTVTLRFERDYGYSTSTKVNLYDFAVMKAGEEICVNLLEPGSLGTEVLYNVDNVNMVRRLKVKGPINDDDWQRIYMMNYLNSLDLSECTITEIKASQVSCDAHSSLTYLTTFKLPATLKTIGKKAFYRTFIVGLDFPDGLETIGANAFTQTAITKALLPQSVHNIGSYAFSECGGLQEVFLPDSASVGTGAFNECSNLKTANLPKAMTAVPAYMFYNCVNLDTMAIGDDLQSIGDFAFYDCSKMKMRPLPNTMKTIGSYAFYDCLGLKNFTLPSSLTSIGDFGFQYANNLQTQLPATLTSIGEYAFQNVKLDTVRIASSATIGESAFTNATIPEVTIGKNVSIGNNAFSSAKVKKVVIGEGATLGTTVFNNCDSLETIEFPTSYYQCTEQLLANITSGKLEKVVLKSPTMVQGFAYTSFFSGVNTTNTTIYVPSFQRNNYRLDSYWYNYPIEGFDVSDVTDWEINSAITFGAAERFADQSNLTFTTGGSMKVNGDAPMVINNLETNRSGNAFSMLLSNCDNVSISGSFVQDYYTAKNTWNFITLPFDFKVSDVTSLTNAQMVMRYYDGAHRAVSGTGSNWKNLPADSIVPAGSGFILMTSKDGWVRFTALNNASKQNAVAHRQLAKSLKANPSETTANKGWNLVGNMWLTYFNNHKLNFTAPITVWTGSTYKAYSLIDDDYAIRPMEAFFVQCPDEVGDISFPIDGRQLTSVIESQNASRGEMVTLRRFVELALTEGDSIQDETRIVLNEEATMSYEPARDASKFMTLDAKTAQIWTVGGGVNYAINERPIDNAVAQVGFSASHAGQYAISLKRNTSGHVILIDHEMAIETDLSAGSYVFAAEAGTTKDRFELRFADGTVTEVSLEAIPSDMSHAKVYTVDGRYVGTMSEKERLPKGIYVVRSGQQTEKVIMK